MCDSIPASIREETVRAFASEINDATHTVQEPDEDHYTPPVLLPTGVIARRVFVVGALVDTTDITDEGRYRQGRIENPSGMLFIYARKFQSETARILQEIESPTYIAVVGSPYHSKGIDGTISVLLHPEYLLRVDQVRWNRWLRETARQTLKRIKVFDNGSTEEAILARNQYGTDIERYRQAVVTARELTFSSA